MRFSMGEMVQVQNMQTEMVARFKVVWYGGEDFPGRHKLGLEIIDNREVFWGGEYDKARESSSPAPTGST